MMFAKSIGKVYRIQGRYIFVEVSQKDFGKTVIRLLAKGIEHTSGITGYDNGKELEVIYHFVYGKKYLNIKIRIDKDKPVIRSIVKEFPGVEIYERECYELFGIKFQGNPSMRRLLLGHTSPVNPLRKDAKLEREGVDEKRGKGNEKKK